MASGLSPGCHSMSDLLTIRERGVLLGLIQPHSKLIKCTVAQVLEGGGAQGGSPGWKRVGCGVMCLTEDEDLNSCFLRLYCVKDAKLLWEHQLYVPFQYSAPRTFFHTFPAEGHQVGVNFTNETEADEFYQVVEAVRKKQEMMVGLVTNAESAGGSGTSDPADSRIQPEEHFNMDTGASVSIALNKGPLPPLPFKRELT